MTSQYLSTRHLLILIRVFVFLIFPIAGLAQPVNNNCGGAISLTSSSTCITIPGTTVAATYVAIPNGTGCSGSTNLDVWYSFVAQTANPTIRASSGSNRIRTQLFSGICTNLNSLACGTNTAASGITTATINATSLTVGNTYYIRVYSNNTSTFTFDICVTDPARPANDNCSGATVLTQNAGCTYTTNQTLFNATGTAGIPNDCGIAGSPEVWYRFVATNRFPIITLAGPTGTGNVGANFATSGPKIQLLSGTACGLFTSLSCVSGTTLNTVSTIGGTTGLTIGATYYVRVYTNSTTMNGTNANWAFSICIQSPTTASPTLDYSKSYINITKPNGGTIEPGDELEMRGTFAVRTNIAYECNFTDIIPTGTTYVPGTLRILTNEGKIFRQWTDAADTDPASISGSTVNINLGNGATSAIRGSIVNTDRPSLFGGTCVLMATYRVIVNPALPLGTVLNLGGGSVSYKNQLGAVPVNTISFQPINAILYQDEGICANSVGPNSILSEFGGTFGSGNTKDRAASNKIPANYTYAAFAANSPQDYEYGMSNNTSKSVAPLEYSINPNETDANRRVFGVLDIFGDHTGATDQFAGNLPTDVINGATGGYMAMINASYRADTAFKDTVRNLCPNTYYEYAAWFRNACKKCGCDSTGRGTGTAGYEPVALGDSSGVRPNLTFNINGNDYYSTGNVYWTGGWVKKGFTYRTGPGETQLIVNIKNNAPGGGGNDWAIDDIAVATCLPNMRYSPSLNPVVCEGNARTIRDTVSSFYNNYTHHQWQRSTDGGATWIDLGAARDSTPVYNSGTSSWEYISTYTIPPTATTSADDGDLYRVIAATTSANLSSVDCQVTSSTSIINLSVLPYPACIPLATKLIAFNGKLQDDKAVLSWTTSHEDAPITFSIEKSFDGFGYSAIGTVLNYNNGNEANYYNFTDQSIQADKAWYRIVMVTADGKKTYSSSIQIRKSTESFALGNVINPFTQNLSFEVISSSSSTVRIELIDMSGKLVRLNKQTIYRGTNSINLSDISSLQSGMYTLRVIDKDKVLTRRVIKGN
jgi:trimeric autotransporter adhesin